MGTTEKSEIRSLVLDVFRGERALEKLVSLVERAELAPTPPKAVRDTAPLKDDITPVQLPKSKVPGPTVVSMVLGFYRAQNGHPAHITKDCWPRLKSRGFYVNAVCKAASRLVQDGKLERVEVGVYRAKR